MMMMSLRIMPSLRQRFIARVDDRNAKAMNQKKE